MEIFIFRNSTIEPFFTNHNAKFSGYGDISIIPENADVFIWFYTFPIKFEQELLTEEINDFSTKFKIVLNRIPSSKTLIAFTLEQLFSMSIEISCHKIRESIENFNDILYKLEKEKINLRIINFQSFTSHLPIEQLIDWKYYYLSETTLNPKLAYDFSTWFYKQLDAISMKRKKCLVLDLDNTIWGGILGEDGITGIQTGGNYPGNAFLDFQKSILALHKAGVILTVCSKNNESDVIKAWDKNPHIYIKKEHLACYQINWKSKVENIEEIIRQLNIGPESMVYFDDNPAERELVKQYFPEIVVPEFPAQPYLLPVFINNIIEKYFKIYRLTGEDYVKTQQYKQYAMRKEFQKNFSDYSNYLASLEIVFNVQSANYFNLPRIIQLTQKTNQFNLTTKRYNENDIYKFLENNDWVFTINVSDKFGNNGITGLIILSLDVNNSYAEIDTFLLSCRILGKGIEFAFINYMLNKLKNNGFTKVKGTYVKTLKNDQVANFYDKVGFTCNETCYVNDNEIKVYHLDLSDKIIEIESYYNIIENGS